MPIPKFKLENVKQNIDYFGNNVTKLKKSVSKRLKTVLVKENEDVELNLDEVTTKLASIDFDQPEAWIRNVLVKTLKFSSDQGYINQKDMQIFQNNVLDHISKSNLKDLRDELMNNLLEIEGGNQNYIDIDSLAKYDNRLKDSGLMTSKVREEYRNTALKLKLDMPVTRDEFNELAKQDDNTLIVDNLPYGREYFTKDDLIESIDSIDQVDIASLRDSISQNIYINRQNINKINKRSEYLWEDVKDLSKDIAKLTEKYMTISQKDEKEDIYGKLTSKQKEFLNKKSNIVRNNGQIDKNLKSIEGYKRFMRVRLGQLDSSIAVVSPQDYFDKGFGVMNQSEYNNLWEKVDSSSGDSIISVLNESLDNRIIGSLLLGFVLVGAFSGLAAGAEIDSQSEGSILSNSNEFDLGSINHGKHFELDFWKNPANFKTGSIGDLDFDKAFNNSDDLSDAEVKNTIENMLSNYSSVYLDNENYNLEVDPEVELKEDGLDVNQMNMSISSDGTVDGLDYKAKGELDLVLNNLQDSKAKLALSLLYDNAQHGNYISIEKGTDMYEIALSHGIIANNGVLSLNYQNLNKLVDAYFEGYGYHETELSQHSFGLDYKGNSIDIGSVQWDSFLTSIYLRSSSGEDVESLNSNIVQKDGRYIRNEVHGEIIGAKEYGLAGSLEKIVDEEFKYEIGANVSNIDWDNDESEWNFGVMGKANYFDLENDIEHEVSIQVDNQRYKIGWNSNKDIVVKGQDGNIEVYANYEGGESIENNTSVGIVFSMTWGGSNSNDNEKGYQSSNRTKDSLTHQDFGNKFDQNINFQTNTIEESILDIDTENVEIVEKDGQPEKIIFDTSAYGEFTRILSVSGSNFDDNFVIEDGKIALKDIKDFSDDMPGEKGDELNLEIGLETVDGDYSVVGIDFIKSSIRFEGKLIGRKNIQDIKVVLGIIDDKIDDKLQKDFLIEKTLDENTIQRAIYQDNQNFNVILKLYLDGTYGPRVLKGVANGEFDEETIEKLKNGEIDNQEAIDRLENGEVLKDTLSYLDDYMDGITQDPISNDINLLVQKDDVKITWESSNPELIDTEGNVTRPESGLGNATVTLTAKLSIGDATVSKDYELEVLEKQTIDNEPIVQDPSVSNITNSSFDVENNIQDADGVRNIKYYIYSDSNGSSLVASNTDGTFTGLDSEKTYYVKTTSEVKNADTGEWLEKESDLTSVTTNINEAPRLVGLGIDNQIVQEGSTFSLDVSDSFEDPNGDDLTYTFLNDETGSLSIDKNTGIITGTLPNVNEDTTYNIEVLVEDDGGLGIPDNFNITVTNEDTTAPSLLLENLSGLDTQGQTGTGSITFDEDIANVNRIEFVDAGTGDKLGGIDNVSISGNTVSFDYTAPNVNEVVIKIDIEDDSGNSQVETTNSYTLSTINQPPYINANIDNQVEQEGASFSLDISYYLVDPDGNSLYTATGLPSGLSIDENTGMITGTLPSVASDETYNVTVTADDGEYDISESFDITVTNEVNQLPTANSFTYGTDIGNTETTFNWEDLSNATDPDGDTLTASIVGGPSKGTVSINASSLTYAPNEGETGNDSFDIEISDGNGGTTQITITVENIDTMPPIADGLDELMKPGETKDIIFTFSENIQNPDITVNEGTYNSHTVNGNELIINYTAPSTSGTYESDILATVADEVGNERTVGAKIETDGIAPSLTGEDLSWLDTQGETGSGSVTFDEDIANVKRIEFVDASTGDKLGGIDNVSIDEIYSNEVNFDYAAPNIEEVMIEIEAEDSVGNSKVETTNSYTLTK